MREKRVSGGVSIAEATRFAGAPCPRDADDKSARWRGEEFIGAKERGLFTGRSRAGKPEICGE